MIKMKFLNTQNNNINVNKFLNKKNIYNGNLNFYVCGSGGCGSTLIFNYLKNFGKSYHIHDRFPPEKLCYVGDENTNTPVYSEWFNKTEIPEDKLSSYKVLFVYRNPIQVIFSRFATPNGPNVTHLKHIMCDNNGEIYFGDVIKTGRDLYKLEEFFDNYTIPKKRNYDIICVKYEDFFKNISVFNNILGIPDIKELYPNKSERIKNFTFVKELSLIYNSLMKKMNMMRFIEINKKIEDVKFLENNESNCDDGV
jgi:hypothetical protein